MDSFVQLVCPQHQLPLTTSAAGKEFYSCPNGCHYEILSGIPRFVQTDNYASSFGLQWNTFRLTQLDSYTGIPISRERLKRIAGGSLEIFKGKKVLEVGCGAGRFTEIMLKAGAFVFAVDISNAVEANYKNLGHLPMYFTCQADVMSLPVAPAEFDIVVCIGVVQHTPNPEETMRVLCSHLRPGGTLLMDHYTYGHPITPTRKRLRSSLLQRTETQAMKFVQQLTSTLWWVHRFTYRWRRIKGMPLLRSWLLYWSPIVDYHEAYPQLEGRLLYEWAILDTHDSLTDRHKHLRSTEELVSHLNTLGLENITATYAGNGVEIRAIKP